MGVTWASSGAFCVTGMPGRAGGGPACGRVWGGPWAGRGAFGVGGRAGRGGGGGGGRGGLRAWWGAWRERFGLAEVCGTLTAVGGFAAGYLGSGSLLAAAG